jgi:hypothetical protein
MTSQRICNVDFNHKGSPLFKVSNSQEEIINLESDLSLESKNKA